VISLEQRPLVLLDRGCNADEVTCLGVALGNRGSAVPKQRVVEIGFSPVVKTITLDVGGRPQYSGFDRRALDLDTLYASVIYGSGVLHTDAEASFTVIGGRVDKISLYGRWLAQHADLNTLSKLHQRFRAPDRCLCLEAEGDLIGYDNFYAASKKWVRWLAARARPTVVLLGGNADAVRAGDRGGVSRRVQTQADE
jgi:hypothetical protein